MPCCDSLTRKATIVAVFFLLVSVERFGLDIGVGGHGLRPYHFGYLLLLLAATPKLLSLRLSRAELVLGSLYVLSTLISVVLAYYPEKSLVFAFNITLVLLGPFVLGYLIQPTINEIVDGMAFGALPSALFAAWQLGYYSLRPNEWSASFMAGFPRVYAFAYEPGNLAHMLFFGSIPLFLPAFRQGRGNVLGYQTGSRLPLYAAVCNFAMLLGCTGRTGWLCAAVFVAILIFYRFSLRALARLALFCLPMLFLFSLSPTFGRLITDYFDRDLAGDPRVLGFLSGCKVALNHWGIGVGPGGFGRAVMQEDPGYVRVLTQGAIAKIAPGTPAYARLEWEIVPFNALLEHLVNYGFVGVSWAMLGLLLLIEASQRYRAAIVVVMLASGLAGVLVNQNLFRPYMMFAPCLFMGAVSGLRTRSAKGK